MDWSIDGLTAFITEHRAWAPWIFGAMAFGESLAFIGILIPATSFMIACGALVGNGTLALSDLWLGGAVGAALGDTTSYALGRWLGPRAHEIWPFSKRRDLLDKAERFFAYWGWAAVFFGRFIGPLRAVVPLAAGMLNMPNWLFQLNNVLSGIVWIPVLISPAALVVWIGKAAAAGHVWWAVAAGAGVLVAAIGIYLAIKKWGGRMLPGKE
jgi:membrane protein DedA with SNARE-associated domain